MTPLFIGWIFKHLIVGFKHLKFSSAVYVRLSELGKLENDCDDGLWIIMLLAAVDKSIGH